MARTALWLAGPLAIAAVVGGTMLRRQQRTQAEIERQVSAAQGLISEGRATAATALALRAPMEAAFDAGSVADGEAHWSRLRAGLAKADEALARSLATLDRAMPLSPGDPAIVGALQTALRERIGIAVAHHRPEEARALSARLEATAPIDGAPAPPPTATLKLGTEPPAEVVLERFATGAEVTWQLQESRRLGRTPVAALPLPAGSYVFALTAAGHAPVRRPLVVDPGDTTTRQLTLSLPKATDVPPGFIYIPPGEFRFGAATDETFRRGFLNTSPLRRLETHAYLIGRHEVTYGEYLPFLEALPAAERIRRTPGSAGNGFAGAVQLRPGPGAGGRPWQFSFVTIAGQRVTARAGDPFVLPGRPARASQDWARLPVSGISADDARAFAAWLAATKRVPGARLCNEIEWERAARGADGRIFPHGNVMESHDANFAHTYEGDRATSWKAPDEVGAHPASRSPFGLDDTAGNVWELVETAFGAKSHGPPGVSVRGGSYDQGLATLWLANRQVVDASYRDPTAGLRLCADVTPELR